MNIGIILVGFGALLLLLHGSVLPRIDRLILRWRPASRFASDTYVAWRQLHRRAGLIGGIGVIVLGVFVVLFL